MAKVYNAKNTLSIWIVLFGKAHVEEEKEHQMIFK